MPSCRVNRLDWAALTLVLLLTLGFFCMPVFLFSGAPGEVCLVSWEEEELRLSLDVPDTRTIVSRNIAVTIAVSDGCVSVAACGCPDQVCVKTGAISLSGEMIVCVPAGVVIRIPAAAEGEVPDYVLG